MGRPAAARQGDRGGESIPTLRTLRLRLTADAAAAAIATGLATYPIVVAGVLAPLIAALAGIALLCTLLAIVSRRRFVGAALFALATEYVVVEATGRAAATSVVAYAVGLILLSELLLLAAELPRRGLVDASVVASGLLALGGIALAAALLALVTLAASAVRLPGGFEAALLGSVAAVALLGIPLLLLRRGEP